MIGPSSKEEPLAREPAFERRDQPGHMQGEADGRQGARLQEGIGREVRSVRNRSGMSATELATKAKISPSMLSRLEAGSISPSLDTLQALSAALGVSLGSLFRHCERERGAVFVKAGGGVNVKRPAERSGERGKLLGHVGPNASGVIVEPRLITLCQPSDEFPASRRDGMGFIFMLEGEMVIHRGDSLYRMSPGDSLSFNAGVPHGRYEPIKMPTSFLSVVSYRAGQATA